MSRATITQNSADAEPCTGRALAPAGSFVSPWRLVSNAGSDCRNVLVSALRRRYTVSGVQLFGSGTESLFRVFSAIKSRTGRDTVCVSSYVCPDVCAAALRAGCKVRPLEIHPLTLQLSAEELSSLDPSRSMVVLTNLYGLADSYLPFRQMFASQSVPVIDDAAQGALSDEDGCHVGARPGTIGVLSFGRGKAISGVGGGAVLFPDGRAGTIGDLSSEALGPRRRELLGSPKDLTVGSLMWLFQRPSLYWLPASLKFLRLGETVYSEKFALKRMSAIAKSAAAVQVHHRERHRGIYISHAKLWSEALTKGDLVQPYVERGTARSGSVAPIRYPILFPSEATRDECWRKLSAAGLGASRSYPRTIAEYPEIQDRLVAAKCPNALRVSRTILTLPVHEFVTAGDVNRAARIISQVLGVGHA